MQVLLVEDNDLLADMISKRLEAVKIATISVSRVASLAAAREYLYVVEPDVILLDLNLPDSEGLDTFHAVAAAQPQTAIVVLSAIDDRDVVVEALRQGAHDYIVKGKLDPIAITQILSTSIERHAREMRRRAEEEEEIKRQIASLEEMRSDDPVENVKIARRVATSLRRLAGDTLSSEGASED